MNVCQALLNMSDKGKLISRFYRMEGLTMSSKLLKGTAILTIGLFLSKALGLLYVIPFYAIVGEDHVTLYQYAYIPYNIALSIAIAGAPLAISKFVARYNAMGDYAMGRRLLKGSMGIMMLTGVASFLILYFLAEPIAHMVITDKEQLFTTNDIATVIRWVSFALIVVPVMSIVRGFLQGYGKMEPTAVSQLIEQIVRIVVVLAGALFVVYFLHGSQKVAVNFAVFAATIGSIASLGVLYWYWRKYKPEFDYLLSTSTSSGEVPVKDITTELITYIIPFVLVGVINPLYQMIDMLTFNAAMKDIGLSNVSDTYLGMLNFTTHKLVMIPVMVATGFSMALIPVITEYFTKQDHTGLKNALDQTYQIMIFLTVPMVTGIAVLSAPLYHALFKESSVGAMILGNYAPVAILFGLYTVTAAILQGIDRQKWIIFTSLLGLFIKLVLNIPLIKLMETNGAILATAIGYGVAVGLNIIIISIAMEYRSKLVIRRTILIALLNLAMFIAVFFTLRGLIALQPAGGKLHALLYVFICTVVGVAVYGYLSLKTGLVQKLFGDRIKRITSKFGF